MLDEAYKLRAQEEEMAANISLLPYVKDSDRKRYLDALRRSQRDIIELGKQNDDYSGLDALKKNLGTVQNNQGE
jgi:hypothetical protein